MRQKEQIDPRHILIEVAEILKKLKISYLVTGGMAVVIWGRPRFTADIDIVIELTRAKADFLAKALKWLSKSGYIDDADIKEALQTRGEFNFIDPITGVKVDFWILKNEAFDYSRLKRRVAKKVLGKRIFFTSPEDLILIKLVWHRESGSTRQLEDVESIFRISGKKLDIQYLNRWAKKLGVLKILKEFI